MMHNSSQIYIYIQYIHAHLYASIVTSHLFRVSMHLETSKESMTFQAFEAAMEALHLSRQVSYRRGAGKGWGGWEGPGSNGYLV